MPCIEGDIAKEPVMVVLVGLPGSGKSHFCLDLFEEQGSSEHADKGWVHVCQDTLGTRKRCEALVTETLESGRRVIIDRCNQSVEQRKVYIYVNTFT